MTRNEKDYLKGSECGGEKPRYCRVCGEIIPKGCYYVNFRGKRNQNARVEISTLRLSLGFWLEMDDTMLLLADMMLGMLMLSCCLFYLPTNVGGTSKAFSIWRISYGGSEPVTLIMSKRTCWSRFLIFR